MKRCYYVYILASRSRNLYIGVTGDLERRMIEHRQGLVPGFTSHYRIFRLVHVEGFADVCYAIAREKELKGWRREKKLWLIQRTNPTWEDLAGHLGSKKNQAPGQREDQKQIPHQRSPKAGDRVRDDSVRRLATTS